ncbi:MAG: hypothetical protein MJ240_06465, partial [Kiritimatiellae bacterium]|nr:hypothetical protein [Kiritimatiellia bacterium]
GVKARHSDTASLRNEPPAGIWASEAVELDLVPDGGIFEYYQFLCTHRGETYAMFYSEGGAIRPDPYGPVWEMKAADCDDGWTLEARIPLAAFYMTRGHAWKSTWRVNVGRTLRKGDGCEFSCWADGKGFADLKAFKTIKGFPKRPKSEDVLVKSVTAEVRQPVAGGIAGDLKLVIAAAVGGEATVKTSFSAPRQVTLASGDAEVVLPAVFPENGRLPMTIEIARKDGPVLARTYPVLIDYQALRVKLTSPEYRNNFYPDQCADKVVGTVRSVVKGPVRVTMSGPGFAPQTLTLPEGGGDFSFDTKGFAVGEGRLSLTCGKDEKAIKVRRLAPLGPGQHTSWISGGNLIVDGKPVFRRNMYAEYYMGGAAFKEKYDTDDLHQTRWIKQIGTFEPGRLIRGMEAKEARRDIRPCSEIFAKMDELIAKGLKGDGTYYYISDEPECRGVSAVYLKHMYDYACEKDPYHVILCGSRAGLKYLDCADWFETHPYINPHHDADGKRVYGRNFNELGSYVEAFKPAEHPEKCIGCMPTCFSYSAGEYPTFREFVTHTWNFLIHGARTFFPYAYHDLGDCATLYEGIRFTNESIERLADFFLLGTRTVLVQTPEVEGAKWTKGDVTLFAVVNMTAEVRRVTVKGLSGTFGEFRGNRTFSAKGEALTLELAPLEAVVGTSRKLDEGLASYADYATRIAQAEHVRSHRGNQLFGRHYDVTITTSTSANGGRKIFDGTRDVIAWYDNWGKQKFFEVAFTKFVPHFRQLAVYGRNIEKLVAKIRTGGEWKTLEPVSTEVVPNGVVFTYPEVLSTVKLRLEFPKNKVELYEIELPEVAGAVNREVASVAPPSVTQAEEVFWTKDYPAGSATNVWWYVKRAPGQDWLVFELKDAKRCEDRKYTAWGIYLTKTGGGKGGYLAGDVTRPNPGLYTLRLPPVEKASTDVLMVRTYNLALDLGTIACVKAPANAVELQAADDRHEITLTLEKPCEDVSCSYYHDAGRGPEPLAVNGSASVALKPVDSAKRVWKAVVPVQTINPGARPKIRVDILGGAVGCPIRTVACPL